MLVEDVRTRNLRVDGYHDRPEFLIHLADAHVTPIRPVGHHLVPDCLPAVLVGKLGAPAELVVDLARLDALELREQLQAQGTRVLLAVGDVCDRLVGLGGVKRQSGVGLDSGGPGLGI